MNVLEKKRFAIDRQRNKVASYSESDFLTNNDGVSLQNKKVSYRTNRSRVSIRMGQAVLHT